MTFLSVYALHKLIKLICLTGQSFVLRESEHDDAVNALCQLAGYTTKLKCSAYVLSQTGCGIAAFGLKDGAN